VRRKSHTSPQQQSQQQRVDNTSVGSANTPPAAPIATAVYYAAAVPTPQMSATSVVPALTDTSNGGFYAAYSHQNGNGSVYGAGHGSSPLVLLPDGTVTSASALCWSQSPTATFITNQSASMTSMMSASTGFGTVGGTQLDMMGSENSASGTPTTAVPVARQTPSEEKETAKVGGSF